jgi:hypothetical protein
MATCAHCGKEISSDDKFCHACGRPAGAALLPDPPASTFVSTPAQMPPAEPLSDEEKLRTMAEKRVEERRGLIWHLASYFIINLFLWGIWLIVGLSSDAWYPWPVWVTLGWGIGIAFHVVGYVSGVRGESRREEQIQREMERMRQQQ